MPDLELEPHEFRPRGQKRLWSRRTVIQFGLVALCVEAIAVAIFLGRPDVVGPVGFWLIAALTWPWVFIVGAVVGYLSPATFFMDDKQD